MRRGVALLVTVVVAGPAVLIPAAAGAPGLVVAPAAEGGASHDRPALEFWIDERALPSGLHGYLRDVRAAFAFWTAEGPSRLGWKPVFIETTSAAEADIRIRFADLAGFRCGDDAWAQGCADGGSVTLALRTRPFGHMPYRVLRETAEHEIGHALGLGHSSDPGDLMAPSARGTGVLEARPLVAGPWTVGLAGAAILAAACFGWVRRGRARPCRLEPLA